MKLLTSDELMELAFKWLTESKYQYQVTQRQISFVASVSLQYRQGKTLSNNQLIKVKQTLDKHSQGLL